MLLLELSTKLSPENVTSPLNPMPCIDDWKVKLLPDAVSAPAEFSFATKYEYQYLFAFPAAKVGGVNPQPLVSPEKLLVLNV